MSPPMNAGLGSLSCPLQPPAPATLRERYQRIRDFTLTLCAPLETEDYVLQSMPDASPPRWHLAHTTWFFETFLLKAFAADYAEFDPVFNFLFNSYYNAVGEQFPRPRRGMLSRPTVQQVLAYRRHVDEQMIRLLEQDDHSLMQSVRGLLETGFNHEQQHQELLLTDVKHALSCNPIYPAYRLRAQAETSTTATAPPLQWRSFSEGLREMGADGGRFCYDNERPRHRVFVDAFQLAARLTTNAEYRSFMESGGYHRPAWWLAEGWDLAQREGWQAPLYWVMRDGDWLEYTLDGLQPVRWETPVTHISYFEADAFARWSEARLPTEAEWEAAAENQAVAGVFVESDHLHPRPVSRDAAAGDGLQQLYGDAWEWTASPYSPYPGYVPAEGAMGEYNGKFMCNQMVLRGGSCASSRDHLRATYRNYWGPHTRFQFTSIRLAR